MNIRKLQNEALGIAIPVEDGAAVRASLMSVPGGWRLAWGFDGGIRKVPFGIVRHDVAEAAAVARAVNERGEDA
ncbi:MAG: hypothetical protein M3Q74_06080 [Pseudomonadota bacterium]|nr:hypothetical protein [Pseudomonadota bacterium]